MYRLSLIISIACLFLTWNVKGQSPHGKNLTIDCAKCHSPESWDFNKKNTFDHNATNFKLTGQHTEVSCIECHNSLIFNQVEGKCNNCHVDIHQQTGGLNCDRCHNTINWIVQNINEMHEQVSFPLLGKHRIVDCSACHISETNLRFDPITPTCISCHQIDYANAKSPNHEVNNFSKECAICHNANNFEWSGSFNHGFFPLTHGHAIEDCNRCHEGNNYSAASPECVSCHITDFKNTNSPNHINAAFPVDCKICHSGSSDWQATFFDHDTNYFPIYSGKHKGEWKNCTDCHTNANVFGSFNCLNCHKKNDTDGEHDEVQNYSYQNNSCFECHPKGN